MAKRRARGEGGVYFDEGRKLWVASVVTGVGPAAKRHVAYSSKSRIDALEKAKVKARSAPAPAGPKQTVAEYLKFWLKVRREGGLAPKTDESYTENVELFLIPYLGDLALSDLTALHIHTRLFEPMTAAGKSARRQALAHATLRTALSYAVGTLRVLPYNPAKGVSAPKGPRREGRVWTADEARRFLASAGGTQHTALYCVAANTGARQGELLGLHWPQVDLKAGTIRIEWNLVEIDGAIVGRFDPKTAKSKRTIPLDAATVTALRRQRERLMAAGLAACPWVFPNEDGGPMLKSNLLRAYYRAIAKAGVPKITFHSLRHTHASLLMAAGVDPKSVSERLGHAGIEITLQTYTHVTPERQREVSETFAKLLADGGTNAS